MSPPSRSSDGLVRYCASCGLTVACWALWLVLGASLAALVYIAVVKDVPVPDFVLRRAEAGLSQANFAIKFGRAIFDPSGKVLFENVQLQSRQFEEPLLTCRLLYVRLDFWSALSGRIIPEEIRVEGAALQLPAMLSPSGTVEPLINDIALVLRHEDNRWLVDQLTGRIGSLAVTVAGEVTPPARPPGAVALSPDEITASFLKVSRRLVLILHQLEAFEQPALAIRLESLPGIGNLAHLQLTAQAARQPWGQPLTLGPFAARGTLRLDGSGPRPLRLHLTARDVNYQETYAVDLVRAILTTEVSAENISARPVEIQVDVNSLTAHGLDIVGPMLRAGLTHWPQVHTTFAAQVYGEFLTAEADVDLPEQSARLRAEGRGSPVLISNVLTTITPRAAPYFVFGDPVSFHAEVVLGPGWKFVSLDSRADAGRIDSHGVKLTAARGRIEIKGMDFLASDARVALGENWARGSYWMNFSSTDYRMLLTGQLRPPAISGWFGGDWWTAFWDAHFAFPVVPPSGDADVSGRWRDSARTAYFGSSDARDATVWGGEFEQTHAVVFLRPHFTDGLVLAATRAG